MDSAKGNLLHFFYEGLMENEKRLLDSTAGGAFVDLTLTNAESLIAKGAANAQQYGTRASTQTVNEISTGSDSRMATIEAKLAKLTTFLIEDRAPKAQACGIYSVQGHTTDACPTLFETENANAIGFGNQQGGNPYSNTYNPGWRNHPNVRWSNIDNTLNATQNRPPGFPSKPQVPLNSNFNNASSSSNLNAFTEKYDKMFEVLTTIMTALSKQHKELFNGQAELNKDNVELKKQVGDLVKLMSQNHKQGKLPAGTVPNPTYHQVNAITTRNGKVLGEVVPTQEEDEVVEILRSQVEDDPATSKAEIGKTGKTGKATLSAESADGKAGSAESADGKNSLSAAAENGKGSESSRQSKGNPSGKGKNSNPLNSVFANPLLSMPFPSRFAQSKKAASDKEIFDTFRKVQVNIPLLEAIKQVPKYAKFLKELCTSKRRLKEGEVVRVNENVSAVIQRKLPPKCKDPGSFTIPCTIGKTKFKNAMLDLGASINVMPYFVYASLGLRELKKDNVIIELADRSNVYPRGLLEDVLVQVNHLIFPTDFYVLDMDEGGRSSIPLLLGKPFISTARTRIDVREGALTMEFEGDVISFNISEMSSS